MKNLYQILRNKTNILFIVLLLIVAIPQNSHAGLDIEYLVDNRIESMGVPFSQRYCVKERTMQRLNEIGSAQTYVLDRLIRTVIKNAYEYCTNGY